jgi:hypothetical protein
MLPYQQLGYRGGAAVVVPRMGQREQQVPDRANTDAGQPGLVLLTDPRQIPDRGVEAKSERYPDQLFTRSRG